MKFGQAGLVASHAYPHGTERECSISREHACVDAGRPARWRLIILYRICIVTISYHDQYKHFPTIVDLVRVGICWVTIVIIVIIIVILIIIMAHHRMSHSKKGQYSVHVKQLSKHWSPHTSSGPILV